MFILTDKAKTRRGGVFLLIGTTDKARAKKEYIYMGNIGYRCDERLKGVCGLEAIGDPSIFNIIRSATALARMWRTLDLRCEENAVR